MPQARVTCYAASAQRRRREAQARSTGAQRRRAAPNVCSAAGAVPHLAPLQEVRSSWHERSEGHERSPVGVSSRWSCVSAGRRERAASEAKQQATVKYIYTYITMFKCWIRGGAPPLTFEISLAFLRARSALPN